MRQTQQTLEANGVQCPMCEDLQFGRRNAGDPCEACGESDYELAWMSDRCGEGDLPSFDLDGIEWSGLYHFGEKCFIVVESEFDGLI